MRSPGSELDPLAGGQVEAGVARVGALGHDRVVAQPQDSSSITGARRRRPARLTRYEAKRATSRCGSCATTSTPSAGVEALLDRRTELVELGQDAPSS